MAAAAPSSDPLRSSPSARPLDHAQSRQRGESGPSSGSRHRAATAAPQKRPQIFTGRAREERLIKRPSRSPSWLLQLHPDNPLLK
ncbi:hypothetical protein NDU88_002246 [Pleurodeles waltl]|uniref:Uncharacterized protein n=1 Tax=Pleurodeles waltl TaxID=8319 RepID=A0AAV7UBS4_PLEWA|nr:hypothetical protein NDU88_002246 [Pleurodeles waltl]